MRYFSDDGGGFGTAMMILCDCLVMNIRFLIASDLSISASCHIAQWCSAWA